MQIGLVRELGCELKPGAAVLDLGCGNGSLVKEYRRLGYEAFGCDFAFKEGPDVQSQHDQGLIRLIERSPYRLPYPNDSFDIVLSDQVFEHVADYDETLAEIHRVLKCRGIGLNFFPSRYTPLEPHVHIPLGTIIQKRWWLAIWAALGIRTRSQRRMAVREVVDANHEYLTVHTNYLSEPAIKKFVSEYFEEYSFCEGSFLKVSNRGRFVHRFSRFLPLLNRVYGLLRARVLFFRKVDTSGLRVAAPLTGSRTEKSL
jgi:ubiquinone/menaquinone biosynthesis C-methylase UbiE